MSRCYICDARLSPSEIEYESDFGRFKPCHTCVDASGTGKLPTAGELDDYDLLLLETEEGNPPTNEETKSP